MVSALCVDGDLPGSRVEAHPRAEGAALGEPPNKRLQRPAAADPLTGAAGVVLGSNAAAAEPPRRWAA